MDLGDFETTIKVIVVGNGGVGKSSMTARYCKGHFTDTYKKTIGTDFLEKTIEHEAETVKLMIWDTAGQEEFDALTSSYYRGAGACAIVFSTTDRASFDAVGKWVRKVQDQCGPDIVLALVWNKTDLIEQALMTAEEVEATARKLGMRLFRTCVKDNTMVSEVFEHLAAQCIIRGDEGAGGYAVAAVGQYAEGAASGTAAPSGSGRAVPGNTAAPDSSRSASSAPTPARATDAAAAAAAAGASNTARSDASSSAQSAAAASGRAGGGGGGSAAQQASGSAGSGSSSSRVPVETVVHDEEADGTGAAGGTIGSASAGPAAAASASGAGGVGGSSRGSTASGGSSAGSGKIKLGAEPSPKKKAKKGMFAAC